MNESERNEVLTPRPFQQTNHSLKGSYLSFAFFPVTYLFSIFFLIIDDWNEQFRNLNDESKDSMVWNYERWKDPFDGIISFHYIDNFKKLFIL